MKKRNRFKIVLFLILIAVACFLIFKQKVFDFIGSVNFLQKKQQEEEKKEEPQSAAIYCQIEKILTESIATSTENLLEEIEGEPKINKCVHVDENGIAFAEAPIISGGPFVVIYDRAGQELEINKEIIRPEVLKRVLEIKRGINLTLLNFTLISPISADLEVLTSEGWKIYFDAEKNIDKQIDALNKILKQEIKPKEYIDLRVENRAYWK